MLREGDEFYELEMYASTVQCIMHALLLDCLPLNFAIEESYSSYRLNLNAQVLINNVD